MGDPFVLASSPSVPVEIVRAAGFRVVITAGSPEPTETADQYLEPGIFPGRLRHLVEDALAGRLAQASRIVMPRTSDVDYKCFLYLRELVRRGVAPALAPVILYDLLQSGGADVRAYNVARTRTLIDELASAGGRVVSADDLRHEVARTNAARAAARRLAALRRSTPRVTGTEVFPLLAAFWETDPDDYVVMASEAAREIATRPALTGPRVLLTGAPVDAHILHEAIECHDAVVVAEVGPWGSDAGGDDVRCDGDPVAALVDKYQNEVIGSRTPAGALRRWTRRMLDEVDAVVVSLPSDDAVFGWDYPWLRRLLEEYGLPHACLRGGQYEALTAADHARLEAMLATAWRLQEASGG